MSSHVVTLSRGKFVALLVSVGFLAGIAGGVRQAVTDHGKPSAVHACRVSWEVCETSRGMVIPPVGPAKCSWRRGGFDSFEFLAATGKPCDWDAAGEYTADADGQQDVCTDALNSCESYLEDRP